MTPMRRIVGLRAEILQSLQSQGTESVSMYLGRQMAALDFFIIPSRTPFIDPHKSSADRFFYNSNARPGTR